MSRTPGPPRVSRSRGAARLAWGLAFAAAGVACASGAPARTTAESPAATAPFADEDKPSAEPFWDRRRAFSTHLTERIRPPHETAPYEPPAPFVETTYRSGALALRAYVAAPPDLAPGARAPAVLYLHPGFVLARPMLERALDLVDEGFVVFAPAYRAENDNPGDFELWFGELDDAIAALSTLAGRADVDPNRVYAFGHSAGGGLATLLSLVPDLPLSACASSNGVYTAGSLRRWRRLKEGHTPFADGDVRERRLRTLMPNVEWVQRPLWLFTGKDDPWMPGHAAAVVERAKKTGRPVEHLVVDGGHGSSLPRAIAAFVAKTRGEPTEAPGASSSAAPRRSPGLETKEAAACREKPKRGSGR